MTFPNLFTEAGSAGAIERINRLTPATKPLWGRMNVAQMLAHLNVAYEMVYENNHKKPNALMGWILKTFIKNKVVGDTLYPKNSRTAPAFVIKDERDFNKEKYRLLQYIEKTQQLGESHFDNKSSLSFGPLTRTEWNIMFYKHLDHHLGQFGV